MSSTRNTFPADFREIEDHIRRARAERQVYIANAVVNGILAVTAAAKRLGKSLRAGLEAERDRRAIEADAFLKRSVPRH